MAKFKPKQPIATAPPGRPSPLVDTRIIYCGDCLDPLRQLPDACVDLIYLDPPASPGRATSRAAITNGQRPRRVSGVNSNRNYEVFWGERSEPLTPVSGPISQFDDRHASTQAYIDYMRPRCVELARVLQRNCRTIHNSSSTLMEPEHARLLEVVSLG